MRHGPAAVKGAGDRGPTQDRLRGRHLACAEAVCALEAFAAIAFKANATGGVGGAFEKRFHYYSLHREEFLKVYHKRSNVESTFAMVKAKFGDAVRSKTETAMKNEVLCKLLCHNICCVILSQIELGIEPTFWPDQSAQSPVVLPLADPPAS